MDKSYVQKAIDAIGDISQDARRVYLWEFPPEDVEAYRAMPDTPRLESHGQYRTVLVAMQADLERRGTRVVRVHFPVATMLAELEKRNWPNDTKHRAEVTGELGAKQQEGEIGR